MSKSSPPSTSRRTTWLRIVLAALAAGGIGWAWATGRLAAVTPELLRDTIQNSGNWGFVVYVLGFSLPQPVGVTAHLFLPAAGLIWPLPQALLLSQVGLLGGALVSYGGGRAMAPEDLRAMLPPRAQAMEAKLQAGGVGSVIIARLVFFTFFPVPALMGALRLPLRSYLLGTWIGCLPVSVMEVVLAERFITTWTG